MKTQRDSSRFFATQEETITELAERLFSNYQAKRPNRTDLSVKIGSIRQELENLAPAEPQRAVNLIWYLECHIQAAYMAQNSLMRKAKPSLFATTLESLRDKIYLQYNQVNGFENLLINFQESIQGFIATQVVKVEVQNALLRELVRTNRDHIETAEEHGSFFGVIEFHDEAPRKQKVAKAEKRLLVMQKASEMFNKFVDAKQSAGMKY